MIQTPVSPALDERPTPIVDAPGETGPDGGSGLVPAEPTRRRGPARLALPAIVAVALVVRLWDLGLNKFSFDESFTTMAGRMPVGTLLSYLRARDSHPPLDYILRMPLSRLGASEFVTRLPSVGFSVAAVALFAYWVHKRGVAGIVATGLLAVNTFQVVHGRDARMYADLELIGVASVVLADTWLRKPKAWHAAAIAGLVLIGLLTHVQMFLLAAGLLALAGFRTDRDAWRWRAGLAAGGLGWALLWGRSFIVQSQGGHSDWIPRTTLAGIVHTVGSLVTTDVAFHGLAVVGVVIGAVILVRTDRRLGRVWICCGLVPVALAALAGTGFPVMIDRSLTVVSWAPLLALGFLVGGIADVDRHAAGAKVRRFAAAGVVGLLLLAMVPNTVQAITTRSYPDVVLRHIEAVAKPGDVVAIFPSGRMHEIVWTVGVQGSQPFHDVTVPGIRDARGILLGSGRPTGRVWLVHWSHRRGRVPSWPTCGPTWYGPGARVRCLATPPGALHVNPGPYSYAKAAQW